MTKPLDHPTKTACLSLGFAEESSRYSRRFTPCCLADPRRFIRSTFASICAASALRSNAEPLIEPLMELYQEGLGVRQSHMPLRVF